MNEHFKWRKPLTAIKKKRKQENKHMSLKFASMLCLGSCQVSQTTFDILCFWLSDIRISLKGYSEISLKGYIEGERELRDQQMSHPGYSCIISGWWSKNIGSSSIKKANQWYTEVVIVKNIPRERPSLKFFGFWYETLVSNLSADRTACT